MTTQDILNAPYVETLLLMITIALTLLVLTRLVEAADRNQQRKEVAKREDDDMKLIEDIVRKTRK